MLTLKRNGLMVVLSMLSEVDCNCYTEDMREDKLRINLLSNLYLLCTGITDFKSHIMYALYFVPRILNI